MWFIVAQSLSPCKYNLIRVSASKSSHENHQQVKQNTDLSPMTLDLPPRCRKGSVLIHSALAPWSTALNVDSCNRNIVKAAFGITDHKSCLTGFKGLRVFRYKDFIIHLKFKLTIADGCPQSIPRINIGDKRKVARRPNIWSGLSD